MKIYSLERTENFPISRKEAWNFFSNLTNLPKITLAELSLRISDGGLGEIYPGMIITYTVTPVFRIRWRWATEITHVKAPAYFVDEQRFGPYRFWHHQHFFVSTEAGTEVRDLIHYALPFGPAGSIVHSWLVRKRLEHIFDFRSVSLRRMFGDLRAGTAGCTLR